MALQYHVLLLVFCYLSLQLLNFPSVFPVSSRSSQIMCCIDVHVYVCVHIVLRIPL
jgi:hypothetical protein